MWWRVRDSAARGPEEAVRTACAARGLNVTKLRLLHHYSNAVVLLPREDAIAREAYSQV